MTDRNKTQPLARLFSDLPVGESEPLAFNFQGYARTLAELAWNGKNRTPFTVVVRGGWGRGKTTLLQAAQRMLDNNGEGIEGLPDERRRVKTLWFNAWKYPDENTILAGLLGALIDKLRTGGMLDQLRISIEGNKWRVLRGMVKVASPEIYDIFFGEDPATDFSATAQKRAFYDTFRSLFNRISYILFNGMAAATDTTHREIEKYWDNKKEEWCLAVFLDDLDRCRDERVFEVLQAINLFQDQPGVCFFLGLDWERLANILHKRLGEECESFLEKFVQVSLELPTVSELQAHSFIEALIEHGELDRLIVGDGEGEFALEDDIKAIIGEMPKKDLHPRHFKRFLNDLSIRLALLRNAGLLGDGDEQLPPRVILGWHLLREALDRGKWDEISGAIGSLEPFLRQWKDLGERDEKGSGSENTNTRMVEMHSRGLVAPYVDLLSELTQKQREILLHFGSPPRARIPRYPSSQRDFLLADIESQAWVKIDGGKFRMGATDINEYSKPIHPVTLSEFRISKYPVTNMDYEHYLRQNKDITPPRNWEDGGIPAGKEKHPVTYVSWNDADAFCRWLNEKIDKDAGRVALPTEAQREFTARGENERKYPWGDDPPDKDLANFGDNVGDTTPVDVYPNGATPEGVFDLAGNVWEWCSDWFGPYDSDDVPDPKGLEKGDYRVLRGGAFPLLPISLRAAFRSLGRPESRGHGIGFRVVWLPVGGR